MKLSVEIKLISAFGFLLILMLTMVFINYTGISQSLFYSSSIEREALKQKISGNLRFITTQVLMASNDYIITGNKKYTEDYKTLRELFDNYYTEFELSDLTEIEKKLLLDIKSNIDSIDTYSYKIFALKKTGSSEEAINLMEIIDYEFGKNININTTKIFDTIAERIERHKVHGAELKKEQAMVMFYISISGLLFSIIIVVVSYITIVRPIKLLTDFADNIAAGNFESELKVNSKDEIESLANSFNRMSCEIQLSQKILKQNNLFLETVLSTIPSGLMVIDKNGNIKSANKRMGEIINTNPEEIVKKTLDQVLNNSAVKNEIKNIIHDGKNVRNHECRLFDSAQKQKYYDLTLISFEIDEKQNLLIIEDITSRKKAEEKVKQSEAKYKSFIHNFQGIAYRYDFKWQTIFFNGNSKEITGYEYEDIMMNNPSWRDLIFKEDYEYFCKSTEDFLNGSEKVLKRRYRIKRSDDKIIWVQDISEIILIEGSHEYGIQGVIYDITDEILREEKLLLSLQELSKVSLHKDKLLSIISHDLRSPFNALLGSLNILRDNYNDLNETERKEYINISYNVTTNLLNLLNDLLEWSRIQTNHIEFNPRQNRLSLLVDKVVDIYALNASLKKIKITTAYDKNSDAFYDENMIFTVARNLVSNAIKFTKTEGNIFIKIENKKETTVLSIRDNGIGIPENIINDIFNFKKNKSRPGTQNESGTGMGLLLCKDLVEKNYGNIFVESYENKGTTFFVSLPKTNKRISNSLNTSSYDNMIIKNEV